MGVGANSILILPKRKKKIYSISNYFSVLHLLAPIRKIWCRREISIYLSITLISSQFFVRRPQVLFSKTRFRFRFVTPKILNCSISARFFRPIYSIFFRPEKKKISLPLLNFLIDPPNARI